MKRRPTRGLIGRHMRRYALVSGGDDRHRGKTSPSVRAGGQCLPGEFSSLRERTYALKPQFARIFLESGQNDFLLMTVVISAQFVARAGCARGCGRGPDDGYAPKDPAKVGPHILPTSLAVRSIASTAFSMISSISATVATSGGASTMVSRMARMTRPLSKQ